MCTGSGFFLEALEKFVILFSDARCPLPIRFGVFVKIAGVTIIADFGHDGWLHTRTRKKKKNSKIENWKRIKFQQKKKNDLICIFFVVVVT